ncbi:Mevalonate pyrophosphate decarboxylase [Paramicrosporidium saccamoebae]|uniref:Diphosphomevalonate decarboxylase n=1 Tax=Paramicrosporidium saccamoebae TaxID=1246581 RepID=A0A2H9TLM2_9FUNG|nr:Mevalonate pyrophosphate decarboxylase [Paramicrosporidium saccamoebae]
MYEAEAPVNIALVKYWGKRDVSLNLPTNSSLSVTLETCTSSDLQLVTRTIVEPHHEDSVILNGVESAPNERIKRCLKYLRSIADFPCVKVRTENMFPTAAGLASSASGYAALVTAISGMIPLDANQKSIAARLGSGSACRSLFDGFVLWESGIQTDGSDSISKSIIAPGHWPELCCLVLILSAAEKAVSSAAGMERTVHTSELFPSRLEKVPDHIAHLLRAIEQRDFSKFAELVMRDSNQFHAVCMDSYPPVFYLNEASRTVIHLVHGYNRENVRLAYTFDAGPNAFIFCLEAELQSAKELFLSQIPGLATSNIVECRVGRGAH